MSRQSLLSHGDSSRYDLLINAYFLLSETTCLCQLNHFCDNCAFIYPRKEMWLESLNEKQTKKVNALCDRDCSHKSHLCFGFNLEEYIFLRSV